MIFLIVLIVVLVGVALFLKINANQKEQQNDSLESDNLESGQSQGLLELYQAKNSIMTDTEFQFYSKLSEVVKENNLPVIIMAQVQANALITVKGGDYRTMSSARNRINRKSIDFVLVDKSTGRTILCIELDDYTHNRPNRKERDNFMDEVFLQIGIRLIHFKVAPFYDFTDLISILRNWK